MFCVTLSTKVNEFFDDFHRKILQQYLLDLNYTAGTSSNHDSKRNNKMFTVKIRGLLAIMSVG